MKLASILAAAILLAACSKNTTNDGQTAVEQMELASKAKQVSVAQELNFTEQNLFPEGVVYDRFNDRFYVSSTTRGDIGIVTKNGTYTPFITDPALISTTGLEIDNAHKLLYVSNSSDGSVGIYDINTGERVNFVDLKTLLPGSPVFINDIALDPQGNAYVTNSLTPVIYKIDRNGSSSIFYQDNSFATAPGGFGFNGIEYGNSGYLLVSHTARNQVIKFPIANPSNYSVVALDEALNRPDGLLISKDGKQLIVVNNAGGGEGKVISFSSKTQWSSGEETSTYSTGSVFPTTATSDGKNVYVLYAYLNRRGTPQGQAQYTIQQIPLTDARPF